MRGSFSPGCNLPLGKAQRNSLLCFSTCRSKMSTLQHKSTQTEKCCCAFCISLIPESSHCQLVFTKLGIFRLQCCKNILLWKSKPCYSQLESHCHQQRLHGQILCRLCGKSKFFVLVSKICHHLAEHYPWLHCLLWSPSSMSVQCCLLDVWQHH